MSVTRPKRSFAEIVSQAQVMATGLKNNATDVAKRGIDADFIAELEKNRAEAITLNDEQERLKAELKAKTDALDKKMKEINAQLSEAKKVVKLAIKQVGWKEFGISSTK